MQRASCQCLNLILGPHLDFKDFVILIKDNIIFNTIVPDLLKTPNIHYCWNNFLEGLYTIPEFDVLWFRISLIPGKSHLNRRGEEFHSKSRNIKQYAVNHKGWSKLLRASPSPPNHPPPLLSPLTPYHHYFPPLLHVFYFLVADTHYYSHPFHTFAFVLWNQTKHTNCSYFQITFWKCFLIRVFLFDTNGFFFKRYILHVISVLGCVKAEMRNRIISITIIRKTLNIKWSKTG